MLPIGQPIAITISPPQTDNSPSFDYNTSYIPLLIIMKKCTSQFVLYPEVTEEGRLHYHGIMYVKDEINYYRECLPKLRNSYGFVKVRRINGHKGKLGWLMYCMKNWALCREIIGTDCPIYRRRVDNKLKHKITPINQRKTILDYFGPTDDI